MIFHVLLTQLHLVHLVKFSGMPLKYPHNCWFYPRPRDVGGLEEARMRVSYRAEISLGLAF